MCKRKFSTDKAYLSLIFIGLLFLNNPVQSARQMALNLFGDHSPDLVTINQLNNMLVQVNNGEMLIIGGLIDSTDRKDGSFAPILGDIPIIKYLFGVEEKLKVKRELVILLTPKII